MAKASFPVSSARAFGVFLEKAFLASGAALIKAVKPAPVTFTTASNSVQNTGVRQYFMNSSSAQTLTVPSALTEIAIGESITVHVLGTGQVTIAAGSGATVNSKAATLKSDGRYSRITLTKTATNTFIANGDLSAT